MLYPGKSGGLQNIQCTCRVDVVERQGVLGRNLSARNCSQMNNNIELTLMAELQQLFSIKNIELNEIKYGYRAANRGRVLYRIGANAQQGKAYFLQVDGVRIAKIINADDLMSLVDKTIDSMVADEPGRSGDENFHLKSEEMMVRDMVVRNKIYSTLFCVKCNLFLQKLFLFHYLFHPSDSIAAQFNDVARFKVLRWRHSHTYAAGGTGRDNISGIQGNEAGDIGD